MDGHRTRPFVQEVVMRGFFALALLGLTLAPFGAVADVMYARSNGDWKEESDPGRYGALNVLDDDKSTAWCTYGTGKGAEIQVVFSEAVQIDRIKVLTGNQSSKKTFSDFNRVRQMEIVEGDMMHTVSLDDKFGTQILKFDPKLSSNRFTFKLKAGYRGKSKRHACLSDIVFYSAGRQLNGRYLKPHIRKRVKSMEFIDTWISGPEFARDRELIFGINGVFRFVYVPNDPQEQTQRRAGAWRVKGSDPEIKVGERWVLIQAIRDDAGRLEDLKVDEGLMEGIYIRRVGKPTY
jgi:hypothetical protein